VGFAAAWTFLAASQTSARPDGRLNPNDATQTSAVYCTVENGVTIWGIDHGVGYALYTVHWSDVDAGLARATSSGGPILLNSKNGQSLYAQPGSQLHLHDDAGKYDFFFHRADCVLTEKELAELIANRDIPDRGPTLEP